MTHKAIDDPMDRAGSSGIEDQPVEQIVSGNAEPGPSRLENRTRTPTVTSDNDSDDDYMDREQETNR